VTCTVAAPGVVLAGITNVIVDPSIKLAATAVPFTVTWEDGMKPDPLIVIVPPARSDDGVSEVTTGAGFVI
jgi:hypothetical protein